MISIAMEDENNKETVKKKVSKPHYLVNVLETQKQEHLAKDIAVVSENGI